MLSHSQFASQSNTNSIHSNIAQIGSIVAKDLKINRRIETWTEYPNVAAIHPTITGHSANDDNMICIVDLAQQRFQLDNVSMLESYWWLSFKNYCAECTAIFQEHLGSLTVADNDNDSHSASSDICSVICQFLWSQNTKLCGDHHIAELFISSFYETDSLIALRTPTAKPKFDFLSFSGDNPYAANGDADGAMDIATESEPEDMRYRLELLRADLSSHSLSNWFEIEMPSISVPRSTSRERTGAVFNSMMKHWECRLSADKRYLLIFAQKTGEIGDVQLRNNKLFWIQRLCTIDNSHRRLFAVNECDLSQQFECRCLKLVVSRELPARFRILPLRNDSMLIWNFSVNGAVDDLFAVVGDDEVIPNKLRNRICGIENAQNFKNYRFARTLRETLYSLL